MNRRVMFSGLLAGTATVTLASAVSAKSSSWCEDDPLVVIATPAGYQLPVHVTVYAEGTENQVYLDLIPQAGPSQWISWTVVQSKQGGPRPGSVAAAAVEWDVTISVTVPGDGEHFRTRAIASSDAGGTGVRYDDRFGTANRVMELRFSLWA